MQTLQIADFLLFENFTSGKNKIQLLLEQGN